MVMPPVAVTLGTGFGGGFSLDPEEIEVAIVARVAAQRLAQQEAPEPVVEVPPVGAVHLVATALRALPPAHDE